MAITTGLGILIGLANLPGDWYAGLSKPSFNPPNWVFAPAWSVLYVLIGIAGGRIWLRAKNSKAMLLWFLQMILNFSWSPAFFGLKNTGLGLIIILAMLALIMAFILKARRLDKIAALCFVPYLAWVSFATVLNLSLYLLN
ncbi:tryptophan-rich sensory protein [Agrobacterium vitis]|nr:tryptophan-rich sensory protein [Agrobacterium vitis]MBE1437286.1 tryptophan-rich sensory protein [Agrobacterium vitis]